MEVCVLWASGLWVPSFCMAQSYSQDQARQRWTRARARVGFRRSQWRFFESESVGQSIMSTLCDPMDCSLLDSCPWDSPGKNTGVGSHSLLLRIFLAQEWNLGLLHCRQILYQLSHQGRFLKLSRKGFTRYLTLGKLKGGRRRGRQGTDGWMASLTQRTRVWGNSRSWWWTGRPHMLQSMGSQRVGYDWATELNWVSLWRLLEGRLERGTFQVFLLLEWLKGFKCKSTLEITLD